MRLSGRMVMRLRPFTAGLAATVASWATSPAEVMMWCGHPGCPVPVETVVAWAAEDGVRPSVCTPRHGSSGTASYGSTTGGGGRVRAADRRPASTWARHRPDPRGGTGRQGAGRVPGRAPGHLHARPSRERGCPFAATRRRASLGSTRSRRRNGTRLGRSGTCGSPP